MNLRCMTAYQNTSRRVVSAGLFLGLLAMGACLCGQDLPPIPGSEEAPDLPPVPQTQTTPVVQDLPGPAYPLVSKRAPGNIDQVQRQVDVRGKLTFDVDVDTGESLAQVTPDGVDSTKARTAKKRTRQIPIEVAGSQVYEEMLIAQGNLLQGDAAKPILGAWFFLENDVKMKVDAQDQPQKLDMALPLFGVDIHGARINYFRPEGLLTRMEKDLLDQQNNTLLLDFLLPAKEVKVGEIWEQSPDVMAMLLQLEMVFQQKVTTTLTEVKNNTAVLDTEGWVEGSSDGTASKMDVKAKTYFHIPTGRVTWCGLIIKENRAAGHIAPEMEVLARIQCTVKPLDESKNLTEKTIGAITFDTSQYERLRYENPGNAWQCEIDARWSYNEHKATFRMVDKGVLVAQASALTSPPEQSPPDMSLDAFLEEIKRSIQGTIDETTDASKVDTEDGTRIYRVELVGQVDELPLKWIYYQIYKPASADRKVNARQVTLIFTLEDKLQEAFRAADELMIQTFMWGQ